MRCHKQVLEYAFAECHQMETLWNVETLNAHLLNFIYLVWQFQPHFPGGGIAHTAVGFHSLSVWEKWKKLFQK